MSRDTLRTAAFKSRAARTETVTFDGETFEIHAPTVRTRARILERAGLTSSDEKKRDAGKLYAAAVLYCTFVPGTNDRLFEDGDFETLLDDQAGGLVDALAEVAVKFLNVASDSVAAKND